MTDRREAVARAIENRFAIRLDSETGDDERDYEEVVLEAADAAIAAMGLPTREAIEAAIDGFEKAVWGRSIGRHGERPQEAARQRLLDLIPMKEDGDE